MREAATSQKLEADLLPLYGLTLGERLLNIVLDLASALDSEYLVHNFAIASNVESGRKEWKPPVGIGDFVLPDHYRVIHSHLLGEFRNFIRTDIVHCNADHLQSLGGILLLKVHNPGHFNLAWLAPCRPKIQQNCFST